MVEHLIDISSHNMVDDWAAVRRDGITGVSVKVSQATDYLNPLRGEQVAGARGAGVAPGGYHFGDHRYDARAQARYFVANAKTLGLFAGDALAPMYDVENWSSATGEVQWQSRQQISDHVGIWLDVLAEETDVRRALVYGSLSWWGSMLVPADWRRSGIEVLNWVAVYNGEPGNLQGWSDPADALHQHTSDGIVPGIRGRVDKNTTLQGRTTATLLTDGDEDDMELTDQVTLWDPDAPQQLKEYPLGEAFYGIHFHAKNADARAGRIEAKVDALAGNLTDDEANIIAANRQSSQDSTAAVLAAIRAQPTGGQVDVPALATALREGLGDELADELAQRLSGSE